MTKKAKASGGLVPATARRTSPTIRVEVPSEVQVSVAAFEQAIGGRQALIEALSSAETLPEITPILQILGDPQYDGWPLATLCRQAGITPGQLFTAFKAAALARATVFATLEAAKAVPAVTKEVARLALPHDEPCESCHGTGTRVPEPTKAEPNPSPQPCPTCFGRGSFPKAADLDRQQMIFELTGLLKKGGGTTVAVQNTVNTGGYPVPFRGGLLEKMQQAVSEALHGEPVDAEAVEVKP